MGKYRKKPVVIEAFQYDGNLQSMALIYEWANSGLPDEAQAKVFVNGSELFCRTLEGNLRAVPQDWIIKGVKNEFYPCKPDIFEATYEAVE